MREQARRCMDCGVPFCNNACPLGNLIPDWNDLARTGHWREGIDQLHATNNFPEFTGLICPAPCESACVLAIDDDPVMIKQIEYWTIDNAFKQGWVTPNPPEERTGRQRRRRRLRARRPRRRRRAQPGRPSGHRLRARRGPRRAAALRRPRREAREVDHRPPHRRARGRGHRVPLQRRGRPSTSAIERAARATTTRSCSRWARGSSATSRSPGRELARRPLRDGVPVPAQPRRRRDGGARVRARSRPRT